MPPFLDSMNVGRSEDKKEGILDQLLSKIHSRRLGSRGEKELFPLLRFTREESQATLQGWMVQALDNPEDPRNAVGKKELVRFARKSFEEGNTKGAESILDEILG